MATITVTSAADDDGSTGLTLRQAISQASSGDAIEFAADFTITLDSTKGIIIIDKNLSINSVGKAVTVSGNNATAIFRVNKEVSINRLVLKEGKKKPQDDWFGVISNYGILTITNSTLSNNYGAFEGETWAFGGAIYNHGTLSIITSTLFNNHAGDGGAISNGGTLSIINSTLFNNDAEEGGAISNGGGGTLSIINSTLSNNHAGAGGAIGNFGSCNIINSTLFNNDAVNGGAIRNTNTTTITNSTLSGNSASWKGGAINLYGGARLYISFSTIVYNQAPEGAGIYNQGHDDHGGHSTTVIKNSVFANNGPNFSHNWAPFTFQAFGVNFSTDNTCSGFKQVSLDELRLGPLALNTPGTTKTHALLPGSVAIGTVADSTDLSGNAITADQRGASRRLRDAGSYEFYPTPTRGVPLF